MKYRPDITIRDADHNLIAVVEVKGTQPLIAHRARLIHENYRNVVGTTQAAFFLLISHDTGHLWLEEKLRPDGRANFEFEMESVFREYLDPPHSAKDSRSRTLEYVIYRWLFEISNNTRPVNTKADETLRDSEFSESIRNAEIFFELAA